MYWKTILTTGIILLAGTFSAHAIEPAEVAKLLASDGAAGDNYGFSVAVDGNTTVIGAHMDNDNGSVSGSVYVFVCDGITWNEQAKLTASDGAAWDSFGRFVAVDGDTAVIGAHGDDDKGWNSGSVYVFVRDGDTWSEQAKLTANDGVAYDVFGLSLAVDGDTTVIGAARDDDAGWNSGSAYVFVRDGVTWTQQAKLTAGDGATGDRFGRSVAVDGNTVVIGAWADDDNGSDSGSAYVFVRDGITWSEQAKLTANDGAAGDYFSYPVAVDGATAVIGSYMDDYNGYGSGSAYVFVRDGITWVEQAKLTASDGAVEDQFGMSLAVDSNTVVISALGDDDNGSDSGSAYVFVRDGITWSEQAKLTANDGAAGDLFGHSVAVDGATAVIGANEDDDNGNSSGSTYVFSLAPDPIDLIADLKDAVLAMSAREGIINSLLGKCDAALRVLQDVNLSNDDVAPNILEAFVYAVEALRGKQVSEAEADVLIDMALDIIVVLES